jgi:hypothetical protein
MRIPKGVLKVGRCAAEESVSYPGMTGVRLVRASEDKLMVEATDGRGAVRVTVREPQPEHLPGFGDADECVLGFTQIIPADAAIEADQAIGKDPAYAIVNETPPDKMAMVLVPQPDQLRKWEAIPLEDKFPAIDDVIPHYQPVAVSKTYPGKVPAVRVTINAELLADLLKAMVESTPEADGAHVVIDVPLMPGRAIKMMRGEYKHHGAEAVGVLMPAGEGGEYGMKARRVTLTDAPPEPEQPTIADVFEPAKELTKPAADTTAPAATATPKEKKKRKSKEKAPAEAEDPAPGDEIHTPDQLGLTAEEITAQAFPHLLTPMQLGKTQEVRTLPVRFVGDDEEFRYLNIGATADPKLGRGVHVLKKLFTVAEWEEQGIEVYSTPADAYCGAQVKCMGEVYRIGPKGDGLLVRVG